MISVWVAGECSYEITGVIHLLKKLDITARPFRLGRRLGEGDVLVICFSSVPLLGWGRYLKIIHWVANRYAICLIVLCPDKVYRTGVICSRNTMVVNGDCGRAQLLWLLLQAVCWCSERARGAGETGKDYQTYSWESFLESASQALLISTIVVPGCSAAQQKAYRRRDLIVQRLGFPSLMMLKVFMAGQVVV